MKLKIPNPSNFFIFLSILVVWFVTAYKIQPILHFHFQQFAFITSIEFLRIFSAYPGGIADYLAEFIAQFFSFNLFGSVLIVGVASLQGLIALNIWRQLAGTIKLRYSVFTLVLLFGVMVLCNYRYPFYASTRLLFAYLFTWFFCLITAKHPKFSIVFWFVSASLLYYLAGTFSLFVYALSSAILFIIASKQRIWPLVVAAFLLFAGIVPYLGYKFLFQITLQNSYGITIVRPPEQIAYTPDMILYISYFLLPVIIMLILIFRLFPEKEHQTKPIKGKTAPKSGFYKKLPFIVSVQVFVCAIGGYFLFIKYHDSLKMKLLTIEYYAENEKWNDILKVAESIGIYDFRVNFQVNRAYSHLGQLPDALFSYPQVLGTYGLFVDPGMQIGSSNMPTSDLYFDLGFMSESQHWAFEAQTLFPYSPRILKRLIMINLVNRKYKLADEFLKVLDQNMLCHAWVDKYEKYVSDTALAASDKVIAEKRRFTPKKAVVNSGISDGLKLLFETNQDNRMAYDFLLTYFILDINLPEFVEYLKYYGHYNLKSLPSSWEEALAFYIVRNKSIPSFVTPETISKRCLQMFANFNKTVKQFNGDIPAAKSALFRDFGDTYWYYMLYINPKVTNVLKNKTEVR